MSDRDLPRGEQKAATVRSLFDRISPRYDVVNRIMTGGLDIGWRRRTVRELRLPAGSRVLDLSPADAGRTTKQLLAQLARPPFCSRF